MISNLEILLLSLRLDKADKIAGNTLKEEISCDLCIVTDSQSTIIKDFDMLFLASLDNKISLCDINGTTIVLNCSCIAVENRILLEDTFNKPSFIKSDF